MNDKKLTQLIKRYIARTLSELEIPNHNDLSYKQTRTKAIVKGQFWFLKKDLEKQLNIKE